MISNFTNSVQISLIQTLKLIAFLCKIHCQWKNVLMNNEKNFFLTASWLSGLSSAEIFMSTLSRDEWGVKMPIVTTENSQYLLWGSQEASLLMCCFKWRLFKASTGKTFKNKTLLGLYFFSKFQKKTFLCPEATLKQNVQTKFWNQHF